MKVKFKAGSFYPQWHVVLRFALRLAFVRGAKFVVRTTVKSLYTSNDQPDYLKIGGFKSGIKTRTNDETLMAFRYLVKEDEFEFVHYRRDQDRLKFTKHTCAKPSDNREIEMYIERRWGEWLPAFPYAGGDCPPHKDFEIDVKIKRW